VEHWVSLSRLLAAMTPDLVRPLARIDPIPVPP
jgi:hypothetical protein